MLFCAIGAFSITRVDIIPTLFHGGIFTYGLELGLICSIGNLLFYYFYFVKSVSYQDYIDIENHYKRIGIMGRIIYGGFVEEVIFRFGIMSLLLWLWQLIFESVNGIGIGIAISFSSSLFALVHLPG
ncbi:type II CAAX prenyl endopeptidase Rce1 family protein [Bacillus salitolerans]|uniref:Type II CAAX prenyl endopeptidase Rce1 family protein n=1 Tax=Bacillus salitolerans TaxID=1437434 RepID=A0ABW4LWW6_9BACI